MALGTVTGHVGFSSGWNEALGDAGRGHAAFALELVEALVVADPAEQVGELGYRLDRRETLSVGLDIVHLSKR